MKRIIAKHRRESIANQQFIAAQMQNILFHLTIGILVPDVIMVSEWHERDRFLFKNGKKLFADRIAEGMKGWLLSDRS